jgi:hypothetical protein
MRPDKWAEEWAATYQKRGVLVTVRRANALRIPFFDSGYWANKEIFVSFQNSMHIAYFRAYQTNCNAMKMNTRLVSKSGVFSAASLGVLRIRDNYGLFTFGLLPRGCMSSPTPN